MSLLRTLRKSNKLATLLRLMLDEVKVSHITGVSASISSEIKSSVQVPIPYKKKTPDDVIGMLIDDLILAQIWTFNYCMIRLIIQHPTGKLKINRKNYYRALSEFLNELNLEINEVLVPSRLSIETKKLIRNHVTEIMMDKAKEI